MEQLDLFEDTDLINAKMCWLMWDLRNLATDCRNADYYKDDPRLYEGQLEAVQKTADLFIDHVHEVKRYLPYGLGKALCVAADLTHCTWYPVTEDWSAYRSTLREERDKLNKALKGVDRPWGSSFAHLCNYLKGVWL